MSSIISHSFGAGLLWELKAYFIPCLFASLKPVRLDIAFVVNSLLRVSIASAYTLSSSRPRYHVVAGRLRNSAL